MARIPGEGARLTKTRAALYLACMEKCYGALTCALFASLDVQTVTPEQYFDTRFAFFRDHPQHQRLFCDTIANPPAHLPPQLRQTF